MGRFRSLPAMTISLLLPCLVVVAFTGGRAEEPAPVPLTTPPPALEHDPGVHLAGGKFEAKWDSLVQGYQCPEWFRNAKFGIWAHWSAQCVPEQGDWYARNMYIEGEGDYAYEAKHYGPQYAFGFKDIDHAWHAEHWDAERLMALYARTGARYFMALANHHDNFDCYDSTYQPWNSVKVGPMKDIVGGWAEAARRHGMRFGVSNHSSHAWHWFQTAYEYDTAGPRKGLRYDGWQTKADGKGLWWEGLDPQDLYCGPRLVPLPGLDHAAMQAYVQKSVQWHEEVPPMDNGYSEKWFLRCQELVDKYHPDYIYFDDDSLPLEQYGLDIAAHFYNANAAWHGGHNEAVITVNHPSDEHRRGLVENFERGFSDTIQPEPWQTATCIGNWHYQRDIQYKTVAQVVQILCNVVSKNGNLMLNIPVRGDGTIDVREERFVEGLIRWMDVNREGIYDSRPWKVYGEGPAAKATGGFVEGKVQYGSEDVRFTTKDRALYAYFLGWPADGKLTIRTLKKDPASPGPLDKNIAGLSLLGSDEKVVYTQDAEGLHVTLPAKAPSEGACALKLTF